MKTALLHYWMINMRGGENLLAELAEMYPDADIFTHVCRPENMSAVFRKHRITESMVSRLPFARRCCQKYLCLMPLALRRWDLSGYDLIISSESGPVKGIRKPRNAYHLCYCHTPMRYLWDMYREYWNCAGPAEKLAMKLFTPYLRNYDLKSAECVDAFLANSEFVRERIRRIYRRDAVVVHPPVDTDFFQAGTGKREDYYLYAGQLTHYKRPDLAVRACCRLKRKLVIAGEGPMKSVAEACGRQCHIYGTGFRRGTEASLCGGAGSAFSGNRGFRNCPRGGAVRRNTGDCIESGRCAGKCHRE